MSNQDCVILDLCSGTGAWSQPYLEAGYTVYHVTLPECDVRTFHWTNGPVRGVLAAPPCTEFAASGARWWKKKSPKLLEDATTIVYSCWRIILEADPFWWAIENPVGRLSTILGRPVLTFQPWEFGDPWTKRTCLWGKFTPPKKSPVTPDLKLGPWRLGPSVNRSALRSITPPGFARAFFEANP